ncbi:MAG TPA: hypothetical protein VET30_09705, partial [Pseudoxanthomonas sp.]|nr:hypothetical protein [Pseudoxanthomonas sp.]
AVAMLRPFIGKTQNWWLAIHNLRESAHPDVRAQSALKLIDYLSLLQNSRTEGFSVPEIGQ